MWDFLTPSCHKLLVRNSLLKCNITAQLIGVSHKRLVIIGIIWKKDKIVHHQSLKVICYHSTTVWIGGLIRHISEDNCVVVGNVSILGIYLSTFVWWSHSHLLFVFFHVHIALSLFPLLCSVLCRCITL